MPLPGRGAPWPDHQPLDPDVVKAALWHASGNVHRAARLINVDTARLGAFLRRHPDIAETRTQAAELALDRAEEVILDKLEDADRDEDAAKWLLTNAGKSRGYGKEGGQPAFSFGPGSAGQIAIKWQTPEKP